MNAGSILIVLVIAEAAILAVTVTAIMSRAAWDWVSERKFAGRREEARAGLARLVAGDPGVLDSVADVMRALPRDQQLELIFEIGRFLLTEDRQPLALLGEQLSISIWAERALLSARWSRRLRGVRVLTMLGGGDDTVPLFLRDQNPAVRAAAAEWSGDHPSPRVIRRVIELLQDPNPETRFAARDALVRIRSAAVEPLRFQLRWNSNRAAREAMLVAREIGDHRFLDAGITYAMATDPETRSIAADLLGAIGGAAAVSALTSVLADRDPEPRAAAARALGRLEHWRSAPVVAPLLGDPDWNVRREAAQALVAFGAAGLLILRRIAGTRSDTSELAAMALGAADHGTTPRMI